MVKYIEARIKNCHKFMRVLYLCGKIYINNKIVFSISPKYYDEFKKYAIQHEWKNYVQLTAVLNKFFENKLENYTIRKIYRMTLDNKKEEVKQGRQYVIKIN